MIGKNIKEIRKRRGYTLSDLAEKANISKSYLSNIERDLNKNPSLQIMNKIASVLNVDISSLLKNDTVLDMPLCIEKEWAELVYELKELGVDKKQIQQYKTLIQFIKWQKQNSEPK
ncbi:helix-turn-helix domain-containing protein [Peribacillus asahii]|uniref:helix-turn-helix domain-containing protein n=1 Tax=Peribacillus asahii TaxID=228899 RepID=UPI00207A2536|nr:helix-turn-helix transcriptional regulator [Peribacillus asahii]USK68336.1 helix-turn-helix domain-containing protein [Peribacillus asahii]